MDNKLQDIINKYKGTNKETESSEFHNLMDNLELLQELKDKLQEQNTLPEQSERLKGSGLLGKKGDKVMETLSDVFGNKTAEQDSLQTDARNRLTGSGFFGKKGQNLPQLLKAILKRPRP